MLRGSVVSIHITVRAGEALREVPSARAVANVGIEGDRYAAKAGTFSKKDEREREATLIEIEALEAIERECQIALPPGDARRNIVTRGVPLNHLVGREFRVGGATFKGIRLCEPCGHLESLTCKGVKDALVHRGGLRAAIVSDGMISAGDAVEEAPPDSVTSAE